MRLGALFSRRVTWRVARVAPAFLESTPAPPRPEELTQLGHCGRGEGSGTWSMAPAPACLVLRGASATRVLSPAPASSPASGSAGQADALTGSASSHAPPSAATPDSADSPAIPVPRPVANLVFGRRVWNPRPRPARAILLRSSTRRSPVAPPMLRARPARAVTLVMAQIPRLTRLDQLPATRTGHHPRLHPRAPPFPQLLMHDPIAALRRRRPRTHRGEKSDCGGQGARPARSKLPPWLNHAKSASFSRENLAGCPLTLRISRSVTCPLPL